MMPWYIPIIAAVIGGVAGWFVRAWHDPRAERRAELRKTLDAVLAATDGGREKQTNEYKLWALLRHGALRLSDEEFEKLMADLTRCGRGLSPDELIDRVSIKGCLTLAAARNVDLRDPRALLQMFMDIISEAQVAKRKEEPNQPPEPTR